MCPPPTISEGPCQGAPALLGQYPPRWHRTMPLGESGTAPTGWGLESDFHDFEKALWAKALLGVALK